MNILHILGTDLKEGNGVTTSVLELIKNQNKLSNINSRYMSVCKSLKNSEKYLNVEILKKKILKNNKIDIVIFHGIYFLEYLKIYKVLKHRKIPYLITPHGGLKKIYQSKKKIRKKIANFVFKYFYQYSERLIFVSEGEMKDSNLFKKKYFIQNNGIKKNNIKIENKKNINKIDVLFLSRIDYHYKGLDILLDLIEKNKEYLEKNHIYFNIYGREAGNAIGSIEKLNKKIKKINIKNIEYHGAIYGKDKINVYQKSDIFILPSRSEGLPMVVLEALSYKLPCIVSKETNILENILKYKCGWEFKIENNGKELIDILEEYKNNRNIFEISNFDMLLKKEYNFKLITKKSIKEYKEIIKIYKNGMII